MKLHFLAATAVSLLLVGCVTAMMPPPTTVDNKTNYTIGSEMSASIGEPLVIVNKMKVAPQFVATKDIEAPKAGAMWAGMIPKGAKLHAVGMDQKGTEFYLAWEKLPAGLTLRVTADGRISEKVTEKDSSGNAVERSRNKARGWYNSGYVDLTGQRAPAGAIAKLPQGTWPAGKLFDRSGSGKPLEGSFKAEIVYSGKVGNNIKAIYREYYMEKGKSFARPAFSQELSYNLAESKVIAYKSIRIEIIKANNSSIRFKVIEDKGNPWLN